MKQKNRDCQQGRISLLKMRSSIPFVSRFDRLSRESDRLLGLRDILAEGGEDLRRLPLSMRKANLTRLRIMSSDFLNSHGLRPRLKRGTAPSSRGAVGGDALNAIGHFIVVYRPTAYT